MYQTQDLSMQEHDQGTVALDDTYAEESYDYGQYEEGAYDDGSGMIDPNSDMPLAGAGADGNKGKERKWQYKVTVTVQSDSDSTKYISLSQAYFWFVNDKEFALCFKTCMEINKDF